MAQSALPGLSTASSDGQNGISKEQLHELEQYQEIVRLRDAVLAGTHPTIKVPPQLLAQAQEVLEKCSGKLGVGVQASVSAATLTERYVETTPHGVGAAGSPSSVTESAAKRSAPEINPIFLEKSEHLIKAELKLQRQRAERALREEADQRRPTNNTASDFSADIDIPDVLSKALAIVPAVPAVIPAVPDATANFEDRSDSFDDNTFYSSQHDTPDSRSSPRRHPAEEPAAPGATLGGSDAAIDDIYDVPSPAQHDDAAPAHPQHLSQVAATPSDALPPPATVPGLNNYTTGSRPTWPVAQQTQDHSLPPGLGMISQGQTARQGALDTAREPLATEAYAEAYPPSPLLRTHDLHPVAPQPAHYATLPLDSSASNSGAPSAVGTPFQVAALRHDPINAASPDSSPQGGRVLERRRSKKKKRKADRQAAEADTAFIKPEPRSPSPMTAQPYIRPSKRARHAQKQTQGPHQSNPEVASGYDTPDFDAAARGHRSAALPAQAEPFADPQVREGHYAPRSVSSAMHGPKRHSGGYVETRGRVGQAAGYGAPAQPDYGFQEPPEIIYDYRDAAEGYPRGVSHQLPYEGSRMSLRPEGSSYVGAPRPQPQRIFIDATGREYLEPRRPIVRQSVAPTGYYRESEVVYERAPPRAMSRYAEPGHYVEAGPPYAPAAQAYPASRRVVTQPEYVQQAPYRQTYQSEYPRRSMMPLDVRAEEHPGQEYLARSSSVRPPPPAPPIPVPGEDASPQHFGSGPDGHLETAVRGYGQAPVMGRQTPTQAYAWEYEAGPAPHHRGHAAPGPGYYAAPTRGAEEIAFVEQPRGATQEIVYTDSGRDEIYR